VHFSDMVVLGTVHFSDDSVVRIEGHEIVVLMCKNGESQSLKGVYFISRLATNVVSIGQLDEVGYKIDIDTRVIKIWEPSGLVLAKVKCEVNRLYLLHIKLAQSACFTVRRRGDEMAWRWQERFGHINWQPFRS
jgi:hypothetical protein